MRYSAQELLNIFAEDRHQEVVDSIDYDSFSAADNPIVAKVAAASFFILGDYLRSSSLLSQIESCFIDDVEYLSLYGACLRCNSDFDLARVQFERALKINPDLPAIQNNFANLLIDMNQLDEAERILTKLLKEDPLYRDARVNFNRLEEKKQSSRDVADESEIEKGWSLVDPLLLAFSKEEVQRTSPTSIKNKNTIDKNQNLSESLPPLEDYQVASDQLKLAQQAIIDKRFDFALQLCSQVKTTLPNSPEVYECASDAYISKSSFKEAEICILHAIQMGSSSFKLFVNLVTLACMRNDFGLAQFYFERALSIDPDHSSLDHLRKQIAASDNASNDLFFRFDNPWIAPVASN
ncbi:tetratricopeptide repeat protein [Synechococcus sp. AH-558-M21]|nr:tetratricopeptide repeat protein [Synechococcus sp. AH-558-M21]